mgnify:CR=1 FL=1
MTDLLNEDIRNQVREAFTALQEPVQVLFFGSKEQCEYCDDTLKLVEEVTNLSDKLSLQAFDDPWIGDRRPGRGWADRLRHTLCRHPLRS